MNLLRIVVVKWSKNPNIARHKLGFFYAPARLFYHGLV